MYYDTKKHLGKNIIFKHIGSRLPQTIIYLRGKNPKPQNVTYTRVAEPVVRTSI